MAGNEIEQPFYIARKEDLDNIMTFIDRQYKPGHILATDRDFFLYEYLDGENLNFVLSRDERGQVNGMLGFLKASNEPDTDIWTTMWKVAPNCSNPVMGLQMLEFLRNQGFGSVMSSGINEKTAGIYKYLGFTMGCLKQYFIPNNKVERYKIGKFPLAQQKPSCELPNDTRFSMKKVTSEEVKQKFDFTPIKHRTPHKNHHYIDKRFFNHPIYKYDVYGLFDGDNLITVIVTRSVEVNESAILRIVDLYGDEDAFQFAGTFLQEIMYTSGYEYTDLICFGMEEKHIVNAGFHPVDLNGEDTITPNYFAPYMQKNITIRFFTDCDVNSNYRIFKADGDQDRPSQEKRTHA